MLDVGAAKFSTAFGNALDSLTQFLRAYLSNELNGPRLIAIRMYDSDVLVPCEVLRFLTVSPQTAPRFVRSARTAYGWSGAIVMEVWTLLKRKAHKKKRRSQESAG
jgi:hypothetical protein